MSEWQPIETADRTPGRRLLLTIDCGVGSMPRVIIGYSFEGDPDWYSDGFGNKTAAAYGYRVTHWRHLPPPAKGQP